MPPRLSLPRTDSLRLDKELDLVEVLDAIVSDVAEVLDADRGTIYLVDRARGELVSRAGHLPELKEIRLQIGEGVAGWVAANAQPVNVPHGSVDKRFQPRIDTMTGYATRSLLAAPIVSAQENNVIAVLQVLNKRSGDGTFTPRDDSIIAQLAKRVSTILGRTSLRAELKADAHRALSYRFNNIVGESAPMLEVFEQTERAARAEATVLIRGESGSGKEAVARAVHFNSPRRGGPFQKIDCAAIPASLFENELFGHERGAYTGADRAASGKVHAAQGGTLFLDEIGELPLGVQAKLLRLLQERTFMRVGATRTEQADVRFVCATNRNLEHDAETGEFRMDLYYRLRVVEIEVPPLRRRGAADLDRLIDHFVDRFCQGDRRYAAKLSPAARKRLHAHDWPGNVRELENCIESAMVLAEGTIEPRDLRLTRSASADRFAVAGERTLKEMERLYIEHVLEKLDGDRSRAAEMVGMGGNTLIRKLKDD